MYERNKVDVLVLPRWHGYDPNLDKQWIPLAKHAKLWTLDQFGRIFHDPRGSYKGQIAKIAKTASQNINQYDYVVGDTVDAFFWHSMFRLAGDTRPFAILPRFNHVQWPNIAINAVSAILALATDTIFAGSTAAAKAFGLLFPSVSSHYPLGIDTKIFNVNGKSIEKARRAIGIPVRPFTIGFVGRLCPDKDVLGLIRLVKQLNKTRSINCVICYHFSDQEYQDTCLTEIGDDERFHLFYNPARSQLVNVYRALDVFITTGISEFETFGRAPVEAMLCGVPVLAPDYNGYRDNIPQDCGFRIRKWHDGQDFLLDFEQAKEILLLLEGNPSTRLRMGKLAASYATKFEAECALSILHNQMSQKAQIPNDQRLQPSSTVFCTDHFSSKTLRNLFSNLHGKQLAAILESFLSEDTQLLPRHTSDLETLRLMWFQHY